MLIIDVEDKRAVEKELLLDVCKELELQVDTFEQMNDTKEYLVFGSFTVVENFF